MSLSVSPPRTPTSSSCTARITCWPGVRLLESASVLTRSRMPSQKRRATLSSTSASSSAVRISLSASSRSASLMRPLPRRRVEIRSRRSDRASNMGSQVSHGGPRRRPTAASPAGPRRRAVRRTGYRRGPCLAPDSAGLDARGRPRRGRRARPGRLQLLAVEPLELAGLGRARTTSQTVGGRPPAHDGGRRPAGAPSAPSPPPTAPPPARPARRRRSRSPRAHPPTTLESADLIAGTRRRGGARATTVTVQYVLADLLDAAR